VKLTSEIRTLHPRAVFRISRGHRAEVRNVFVRVEQGGVVGHGEASPNAFYAESADDVNSKLQCAGEWLRDRSIRDVEEVGLIWREVWPLLEPSRAAQCALDIALWDLAAKLRGMSVAELALGEKARPVATFCTIGISTREELAGKVAELAGFPLIKIKAGKEADLDAVRFVRERTNARLAVDANCAWSGRDLNALSRELAAIGVEFLEQPLPPGEAADLRGSALPIFADESCVVREDVERIPGKFSGFNIKLVKCGGLTPALAMLRRGRELGLRMMVGCMLESSALISAGAVIAQQTDYADLDGAWLIRDDPFRGWKFESGVLHPPTLSGLGCDPIENG